MKYTVPDGFPYYIELLGDADYRDLLYSNASIEKFQRLSKEESEYRFQNDKWSVKQIVGHMTDHERIMTYRLLTFSRRDNTLLPGYDQELFVNNSRFHELDFSDILLDFINVRNATRSFYKTLSNEQLQLKGKAWKFEMTIEDFLKATLGHELHHIMVLQEKYNLKFHS
jgi:uncharacterized damage-inducible protein DinB